MAPQTVLLIREASWWIDRPDELERALRDAAASPQPHDDQGGVAWWTTDREGRMDGPQAMMHALAEDIVVIAEPAWWLDHMDELIGGIERGLEMGREGFDLDAAIDEAFGRPVIDRDRDDDGLEL